MDGPTLQWLTTPDIPDPQGILEELVARPRRMARGTCVGVSVNERVAGEEAPYTEQRRVCAPCPVRQECLAYAVDHADLVGCRGGTDERERRELRRGSAA